MNIFFNIKTFFSNDNDYLFCNCCLFCDEYVIGDFEQTVLADALKLSLDDLLIRLANSSLIKVNYNEVNTVFDSLSENIYNSCLPIFIESFDGDFGILCSINDVDYLVIKKWNSSKLINVKMKKKDYITSIQNAIDELSKNK